MIITPCKDCMERYIGCHSSCDRYIGWRKEFDEQKKEILKVRVAENAANARRNEGIRKMQKNYR